MKYKVILDNITKEFRCILRDNLTGIYVHGSIAFGCFNFKKSDIDFIVVVKDKISQTEKMALMKVIYDMQESFPEKGIEMSYNSNVNIAYKSKKQEKERIEYA